MKDNESFYLSKESKLYKFFKKLNKNPMTEWLVKKDYYTEELICFTNLCLFLRTSFFLLLYFLFVFFTIFYGLKTMFMSPIESINSNNFFIIFTFFAKITTILIVMILLSLFISYWIFDKTINKLKFLNKWLKIFKKEKTKVESKKTNILIQAIKDRHNKICRSFIIK